MPTHQEKAAKKLQSFYNNGKSTDLLHYNLEKIAKHPEGNQTLTWRMLNHLSAVSWMDIKHF